MYKDRLSLNITKECLSGAVKTIKYTQCTDKI